MKAIESDTDRAEILSDLEEARDQLDRKQDRIVDLTHELRAVRAELRELGKIHDATLDTNTTLATRLVEARRERDALRQTADALAGALRDVLDVADGTFNSDEGSMRLGRAANVLLLANATPRELVAIEPDVLYRVAFWRDQPDDWSFVAICSAVEQALGLNGPVAGSEIR